jgi:hypothetical protein
VVNDQGRHRRFAGPSLASHSYCNCHIDFLQLAI